MKQAWWLLATGCLLVFGCTQERVRPEPLESDPFKDAPLHVSYNMDVDFTDSTHRKAALHAGIAMVYEDRRQTLLGEGVRVVFFSRSSGKQVAVLTADSAVVDDRTKNMMAIGNVVVVSDSAHTTLNTSRLQWDQNTEQISTTEAIHIVSPTEVIDGVGLISDQYLTNYRIFKVKGIHQQ
jgi:LPS export ABC transporter protein LptC